MRISRRMRGLLATALTAGALLALPGAAQAAAAWTTSTLTSTGPYTSGELATYTLDIVNSGTAPAASGVISLTEDFADVTVVGTPTVADGPTVGGFDPLDVTVADGSNDVTVNTTLGAGEDVRVTFQVRLPLRYESSYQVEADGFIDDVFAENDAPRVVSKGEPTSLKVEFPTDLAKAVGKDGAFSGSFVVTNTGSKVASLARVELWTSGNASEFSPDWGTNPPFNPTMTFASGCGVVEGSACIIGDIPVGESRTVTFTLGALTHFGSVSLWASGYTAAESFSTGSDNHSVAVTNGKTVTARVALEGPSVASGNSDITLNGEFVNAGPDAMESGILVIQADGFSPGGTLAESVKSISLSNGATCANRVNHFTTPESPVKNEWYCGLSNIAAGQRVTFTVVTNFQTTDKDEWTWASAHLMTPAYLSEDGNANDSHSLTLNPEKTVDLETTLSSTAMVGADRLAAVTVTVKNNGTAKAERVNLSGDVYGTGGTFDKDTMPSTCTGVTKPQFADCGLGTIEPGQSKTLVVNVRGGASLGAIAVSFSAWSGSGIEANPDNNTQSLALDIVKANTVPLTGVTIDKPKAQTLAQLVKSGVPATVTCPVACKVVGQLQLNRGQAQKLGLVKAPRGTKRAKALPYVVIGTGTKSTNAAGKVTVTITLTKAFKLKVAKLTKPLTVSRVLTVTSLDAASKDASFQKAQAISFKPAKKKARR